MKKCKHCGIYCSDTWTELCFNCAPNPHPTEGYFTSKTAQNQTDEDKQAIITTSKHKSSIFITGIYYLIDGNDIVYVGQSINVYARIFAHQSDGTKAFDRFNIIRCGVDELTHLEVDAIIKYNPAYNHSLPENPIYANMKGIKKQLGISGHQINKTIKRNKLIGVTVYSKMYYKLTDFQEMQEGTTS